MIKSFKHKNDMGVIIPPYVYNICKNPNNRVVQFNGNSEYVQFGSIFEKEVSSNITIWNESWQ